MKTARRLIRGIALVLVLLAALVLTVRLILPKVALEFRRAQWHVAGPEQYEFYFRISCFCADTYTEPFVISVADNRIVGVTRERNGEVLPTETFARYRTVEALFDLIQKEIGQLPASLSVTYDPELGYPVEIYVDPHIRIVDDEVSYSIFWLRPMD